MGRVAVSRAAGATVVDATVRSAVVDSRAATGVLGRAASGARRNELALQPRPTAATRLAAQATMLRRRRR